VSCWSGFWWENSSRNLLFNFFCSSRACSHLAAVFMLLLDFNDRDAGTLLVRSNLIVFSDLTKD